MSVPPLSSLASSDTTEGDFTQYLNFLRRWARGRLPNAARDWADTSDLVQDVLLRTVRRGGAIVVDGEAGLTPYLRQALRNRVRDEVRRVRRTPQRCDVPVDLCPNTGPLPDVIAVRNQERRRCEEARDRLSTADQALIRARFEDGLTYEELARKLGKPTADAARVATRRALDRLATAVKAALRRRGARDPRSVG